MQSKSLRVALIATLATTGLWSSAQAAGVRDTTPAVLTEFNAPAVVDVGIPGNSVVVSFKATDDLSGVYRLRAEASGPTGQAVEVRFEQNFPSTKLTAKMHSDQRLAFLQPGLYHFERVYIQDYAGNSREIDSWTLSTLGRTTFTIKNKKGVDDTPPALVSGKVLTPQVSISAAHPGTHQAPFLQISLVTTDSGVPTISGVLEARAEYCLLDESHCFVLRSNPGEMVPRTPNATLKLGAQVSAYERPGQYHLKVLSMIDHAGNGLGLESVKFGRDVDFSTYFPSTTITLIP